MQPDERRKQILDAARGLFAERPFTTVSVADVAEAAGVARTLVHHYFGGIRELFLAVASEDVEGLDAVHFRGPEAPLRRRLAHNVHTGFDIIDAGRERWQAVIGQSGGFGDPGLAELLRATAERSIDVTIGTTADVVEDTPEARFALRCFQELINEATRAWLAGEATREQAETLIVSALVDLLKRTIPALPSAG
jgi:AcrR family transcriptional regulator